MRSFFRLIGLLLLLLLVLPFQGWAQQSYPFGSESQDSGIYLSAPRIALTGGYVTSRENVFDNDPIAYDNGYYVGMLVSVDFTSLFTIMGGVAYEELALDYQRFRNIASRAFPNTPPEEITISGGKDQRIRANLQLKFNIIPDTQTLVPYALAGAGIVYSRPTEYHYVIPDPTQPLDITRQEDNQNDTYLLIGAGADIPLGERLELGFQARFAQDISLSYGATLGYRFGNRE
jgi:hypothetical protein